LANFNFEPGNKSSFPMNIQHYHSKASKEETIMQKKINIFLITCAILAVVISIAGYMRQSDTTVMNGNAVSEKSIPVQNRLKSQREKPFVAEPDSISNASGSILPDNILPKQEPEPETNSAADADMDTRSDIPDDLAELSANLETTAGLEFKSNNDGTCTLVGPGICTDTEIIITDKSPDGDTITRIDKYAFFGLEDVESVSLINYNYEIDKQAFQYGEFETLNILGSSPVIGKSAFSSCEYLISVLFYYCDLQIEEYAFFGCGKDTTIIISDCTGSIDKRAFQYSDMKELAINNCNLEIMENAFGSCENLTDIKFINSTILADEYAFFGCGDQANVQMQDCSILLDDYAFQFSSINSLLVYGSDFEAGKNAFANCEDLTTVEIDCTLASLDEYSFYDCESLISVSICDNKSTDNTITIDDNAFQFSKNLESVIIGKGTIEIGEYVFSNCADHLSLSIAGKSYIADSIAEGLSL